MKKIPCRDMATKVAPAVLPMVWSIMLVMTIQPERHSVAHWNRRAMVPIWMTSGSSRNRAMSRGAKRAPRTPTASRNSVADFTQNQNASFTRR